MLTIEKSFHGALVWRFDARRRVAETNTNQS